MEITVSFTEHGIYAIIQSVYMFGITRQLLQYLQIRNALAKQCVVKYNP